MNKQLSLLFHFNQHLSPFSYVASQVCYRGLLRVLRAHPHLKFNIHISGTLIRALQWLDSEPLVLIREGIEAGQFELVGSTYAQNVPYATDDWDNAQQIRLHQQVLQETFGVSPVTFWNAERCWRQSLLPVITRAGYRFNLVEDHILEGAGVSAPVTLTSTVEDEALTIIRDDERLKHWFSFATWFGRFEPLQRYVAELPAGAVVAYAEDAEATGLWGWSHNVVPHRTWYHLDRLLGMMADWDGVDLIHLSEVPLPKQTVSPIPDGCAAWMNASLQREGAPYHEPGYTDWFDYNARSPKLAHYRRFYAGIRSRLQKTAVSPAAARLQQAALHNYLNYQYEFGCIGIGGQKQRTWEGARASLVLARAAEWAAQPTVFKLREDLTEDGQVTDVLSDGRQLIVTTPINGRLLYWFDLRTGQQWLGNQLAVPYAPYEGDATIPQLRDTPMPWLPSDFEPQLTIPEATLVTEAPPSRMQRYLPDWVWQVETEPVQLLVRSMWDETRLLPALPAQRRGCLDEIVVDETAVTLKTFNAGNHPQQIHYNQQLMPDLYFYKQYRLTSAGLAVTYQFHNKDEVMHHIYLTVINELCPDYEVVVKNGREALAFVREAQTPAVRNTITGNAIQLSSSQSSSVSYHEAFLALEIHQSFALALSPDQAITFTLTLQPTQLRPDSLS